MRIGPRIVGTVLSALVVVGVAVAGGLLSDFAGGDDAFVIDRFDRDVVVEPSGRLQVTETLEVTFSEPRRGIFRDLPRDAPAGGLVRYDEFTVDQGSDDQPWDVAVEREEGVDRLRIGNPDVELSPGTYLYRLGYVIDGLPFAHPGSEVVEVRLDVPGFAWPTDIGPTTLRVHAPSDVLDVACVEGTTGSDTVCEGSVEVDGAQVTASLGPYEPRRSATVGIEIDATGFDVPIAAASSVTPLEEGAGLPQLPVSGVTAGVVLALLLVAVLGAFEAIKAVTVYRDETTDAALHDRAHPTAVPSPPLELRPSEVAGLLLRRTRDALFLGTLVDLDQRGLVTTSTVEAKKGTGLAVHPGPPGVDVPDADARFLADLLPQGAPIVFDGEYDKDVSSRSSAAAEAAADRASKIFSERGLEHERGGRLRSPGFRALVVTLVGVLAVVVAVVVGLFTALHVVAAVVVAVVAVAAWIFVRWLWRHHRLPLNSAGRDAVAQARAFDEYVRTVEADQLEWAADHPGIGHHHPAVSLLPYAITLGHADSWYRRFGEVLRQVAPVAGTGAAAGTAWWASQQGFTGVTQARSASVVNPASSGGGSVGGGGGSGGGGGGGGSW